MNARAAQILSFLQEQHRRQGYLPSQSEVAIKFGIRVCTVRQRFMELAKDGHLVMEKCKSGTVEYRMKEAS